MSAEIVARFYDNDESNFQGFQQDVMLGQGQRFPVECILVDDETIYPLVLEEAKNYSKFHRLSITGNTKFTKKTPDEFKSLYFGNYFVQKLMNGMTKAERTLN